MRLFVSLAILALSAFNLHACPTSTSSTIPSQDEEERALAILERMREVYASCKSYSDEGEARTLFLSALPGQTRIRTRTVVKPFETIFERPARFRFEFRTRQGEEEWDRYIVWLDDDSKARSFWTLKYETREWPSLEHGLGAARGVSDGTANHVPALLYNRDNWLGGVEHFEFAGEANVEGHPCWRILAHPVSYAKTLVDPLNQNERKLPEAGPTTLWIDRDDHLLRRIRSTRKFEKFSTDRTITYRPVLGKRIPRDAFAVNPTK